MWGVGRAATSAGGGIGVGKGGYRARRPTETGLQAPALMTMSCIILYYCRLLENNDNNISIMNDGIVVFAPSGLW